MPATRNALLQSGVGPILENPSAVPAFNLFAEPENLIERVWKFVKKECLQSVQHASYEAFTAAIDNCLAKLSTTHKERHENPTRPQVSDV